jgi:hypothetical protein
VDGAAVLRRLALSARDREIYTRPKFSFHRIARRIWSMLTKIRLSKAHVNKPEPTVAARLTDHQSSR